MILVRDRGACSGETGGVGLCWFDGRDLVKVRWDEEDGAGGGEDDEGPAAAAAG